jgi:hypothetical protein
MISLAPMGRGLGQRQLSVLAVLQELQREGGPVPLYRLADDPDDRNEMAKARAAVRALRERGLVTTWRQRDEDRSIEGIVIGVARYRGSVPVYGPIQRTRAWSGLHVQLTPIGEAMARDSRGAGDARQAAQ